MSILDRVGPSPALSAAREREQQQTTAEAAAASSVSPPHINTNYSGSSTGRKLLPSLLSDRERARTMNLRAARSPDSSDDASGNSARSGDSSNASSAAPRSQKSFFASQVAAASSTAAPSILSSSGRPRTLRERQSTSFLGGPTIQVGADGRPLTDLQKAAGVTGMRAADPTPLLSRTMALSGSSARAGSTDSSSNSNNPARGSLGSPGSGIKRSAAFNFTRSPTNTNPNPSSNHVDDDDDVPLLVVPSGKEKSSQLRSKMSGFLDDEGADGEEQKEKSATVKTSARKPPPSRRPPPNPRVMAALAASSSGDIIPRSTVLSVADGGVGSVTALAAPASFSDPSVPHSSRQVTEAVTMKHTLSDFHRKLAEAEEKKAKAKEIIQAQSEARAKAKAEMEAERRARLIGHGQKGTTNGSTASNLAAAGPALSLAMADLASTAKAHEDEEIARASQQGKSTDSDKKSKGRLLYYPLFNPPQEPVEEEKDKPEGRWVSFEELEKLTPRRPPAEPIIIKEVQTKIQPNVHAPLLSIGPSPTLQQEYGLHARQWNGCQCGCGVAAMACETINTQAQIIVNLKKQYEILAHYVSHLHSGLATHNVPLSSILPLGASKTRVMFLGALLPLESSTRNIIRDLSERISDGVSAGELGHRNPNGYIDNQPVKDDPQAMQVNQIYTNFLKKIMIDQQTQHVYTPADVLAKQAARAAKEEENEEEEEEKKEDEVYEELDEDDLRAFEDDAPGLPANMPLSFANQSVAKTLFDEAFEPPRPAQYGEDHDSSMPLSVPPHKDLPQVIIDEEMGADEFLDRMQTRRRSNAIYFENRSDVPGLIVYGPRSQPPLTEGCYALSIHRTTPNDVDNGSGGGAGGGEVALRNAMSTNALATGLRRHPWMKHGLYASSHRDSAGENGDLDPATFDHLLQMLRNPYGTSLLTDHASSFAEQDGGASLEHLQLYFGVHAYMAASPKNLAKRIEMGLKVIDRVAELQPYPMHNEEEQQDDEQEEMKEDNEGRMIPAPIHRELIRVRDALAQGCNSLTDALLMVQSTSFSSLHESTLPSLMDPSNPFSQSWEEYVAAHPEVGLGTLDAPWQRACSSYAPNIFDLQDGQTVFAVVVKNGLMSKCPVLLAFDPKMKSMTLHRATPDFRNIDESQPKPLWSFVRAPYDPTVQEQLEGMGTGDWDGDENASGSQPDSPASTGPRALLVHVKSSAHDMSKFSFRFHQLPSVPPQAFDLRAFAQRVTTDTDTKPQVLRFCVVSGDGPTSMGQRATLAARQRIEDLIRKYGLVLKS